MYCLQWTLANPDPNLAKSERFLPKIIVNRKRVVFGVKGHCACANHVFPAAINSREVHNLLKRALGGLISGAERGYLEKKGCKVLHLHLCRKNGKTFTNPNFH